MIFATRILKTIFILSLVAATFAQTGCRSTGAQSHRTTSSRRKQPIIQRIACLYDQRPWLTKLDLAGDRDPEGIKYRVFLDPGTGKGIWTDGEFVIKMYRLDRNKAGKIERTLVSDWIYPSNAMNTIKSKLLGQGYYLLLRWHSKDLAGHEIELVTQFTDSNGWVVRAGTKRFPIPKYSS